MRPTVWQKELCRPAAGPRALEPPAPPAIGRRGPEEVNAVAHDAVALPIVARLVDQLHEGAGRVGGVDDDLDGEVAVVNMKRSFRKLPDLQLWAENHYDRLPALAADLVGRKVDVIVAIGGNTARAAKSATSSIPIVFAGVGDPVGLGLVASLARPGGNLTGFSNLATELNPKRLELLSELVPQAGVIGRASCRERV